MPATSRASTRPTTLSNMAKFIFEIDVYSDPICPWCYLGKEALDSAIASYAAEHPDADFKLTWKPYMLWPNAGVSGRVYRVPSPLSGELPYDKQGH